MVLTATDPGRGKCGAYEHFEEDVAVFICVRTARRVKNRENMTFAYLGVFSVFISLLYMWSRTEYIKLLCTNMKGCVANRVHLVTKCIIECKS